MNQSTPKSPLQAPVPRVMVSIINWNGNAATNACLASFAKLAADTPLDIVVSDNHSTIEPLVIHKDVKASLRSLQVIHNDDNLGYAAGHNRIIEYAIRHHYDYIFLLNNDTEIIDPSVFDTLVGHLQADPDAIAAAPTILSSLKPKTIWYAGGFSSSRLARVHHNFPGRPLADIAGLPQVQQCSFLTGCMLAIKLNGTTYDDVALDDSYFLYWEDADWCKKMSSHSRKLLYVKDASLLHYTSSSLGLRSDYYMYYNLRNHILFAKKWFRGFGLAGSYALVLWIGFKYAVLALVRRGGFLRKVRVIASALRDGRKDVTGKADRSLQP